MQLNFLFFLLLPLLILLLLLSWAFLRQSAWTALLERQTFYCRAMITCPLCNKILNFFNVQLSLGFMFGGLHMGWLSCIPAVCLLTLSFWAQLIALPKTRNNAGEITCFVSSLLSLIVCSEWTDDYMGKDQSQEGCLNSFIVHYIALLEMQYFWIVVVPGKIMKHFKICYMCSSFDLIF